MASYKRKGYTYVSGRYVKPDTNKQEDLGSPAVTSLEPAKLAAPPAMMAMPDPKGMGVGMPRSSEEITLAGIAENAIGASIVAVGTHLVVGQYTEKTLQEIRALLLKLLSLQQQGQGNFQPTKMVIRGLPKSAGIKPIDKPAPPKPNKGMGGEWM